jgi:hypothetical protein
VAGGPVFLSEGSLMGELFLLIVGAGAWPVDDRRAPGEFGP